MSHGYLRLIERLHAGEMYFLYAHITRGGSTVGVICFQAIRFRGASLKRFFRPGKSGNPLLRLLRVAVEALLDRLSWSLLLSGNIYFTGERAIYFSPAVSREEGALLIRQSLEKALEARGGADACMLNNVYDDDGSCVADFLQNHRYAAYPVDPDMFLKIDPAWKSFPDYVDALSSKYRVRLNKVLEESDALAGRLLTAPEITEHSARLYGLYRATADNAAFNLGYLAPDYFPAMKAMFGDDFQVLAYFLNGELAGFVSLLRTGQDTDINYMGLDYEVNRDYKLYNRMLIDLVRVSIDLGAGCMHLGRTATEIKSTLGARPRPMHIYLNSPSRFRARIMRWLVPYFGSPKYTIRHPFRTPEKLT